MIGRVFEALEFCQKRQHENLKMGLAWSSFKLKRKEKKDYKRKLRRQLKEAEECVAQLQEQLQLENELLDQYQSSFPNGSSPGTDSGYSDCKVTEISEMEEEVQALERKLFLEEVALNVTDERCCFLDRNFRLLQSNELNLRRQRSLCETDLEALKLKHEASQFGKFLRANPIEDWVVCSMPNLHFREL